MTFPKDTQKKFFNTDRQMFIGKKIKQAIESAGLSNREAAQKLEISENALYKIFNKEHVNTELLVDICEHVGVPITFFFEDKGGKNQRISVEGDRNFTVSGETNFFSGAEYRVAGEQSEVNYLKDSVKMLQNIIEQKDKIIVEKERLIEEKERFIKMLIERKS